MFTRKKEMGIVPTVLFLLTAALLTISSKLVLAQEWISIQPGAYPNSPQVNLIEESSDCLVIQWELSGLYAETIEVDIKKFQRVVLEEDNQVYIGKTGEPALPILVELIQVPIGMKGEISLIEAEWIDIGKFHLIPNQLPTRDDRSPPSPFVYDEKAYLQNGDIPAKNTHIGAVQGWGGIAVAGVSIVPVRYFPASQELQLAQRITIRIDFRPGVQNITRPHRISAKMQQLHRIALINPPPRVLEPFDFDENEPVRMLFVLKEEVLETAQPLIDFHHAAGLRTDIYVADDLPRDDVDASVEMKDIVREYFEEGLEYLFIIGDGYRFDWDVPMFYWDPEDPGEQEDDTDTHSDNWYVCLDGVDEDGFEDHLPDLAVGRLTYNSVEDLDELEIQIDKIIEYLTWEFEDGNDVDWLSRAALVASDENVGGQQEYIPCKRGIDNFNYELPAPEFIPVYGNDNDVSIETLLDDINDPGIGFFNYRGHGSRLLMANCLHNRSITSAVVRQMENRNRPFILVSSACSNGNIATLRSNCIIETFQKHDGASVVAHGSVISTFTDGNTFFDQHVYRAWFDDGVYDIGYAAVLAMTDMVIRFDRTNFPCIGRMNTRAYIWLGDPALEYRLQPPDTLEVSIPDSITLEHEWIDASIRLDGDQLEGAVICVRTEDDEVYQAVTTDENGEAHIVFDPAIEEAGFLYWTAYYRDGIPTHGRILVADGFGVIEGLVRDFGNNSPIEGARLELSTFNIVAVTDVMGRYFMRGVPERNGYSITVACVDFLLQERDGINVAEDDTIFVNFAMRYSRLELDSLQVSQRLRSGAQTDRVLSLQNIGNGLLSWNASLEMGGDLEPYDHITSMEASAETGDDRLNGVVLIEDRYYITGGNHNGDPNYIHILDLEGRFISRFEQPPGSAGIGIHDLAWDGNVLYGSANDRIYCMTLDGELIDEFDGPFNPNIAITADEDGNLWIGSNNQPLVHIDGEGNGLGVLPNDYPVRALAWYPDADDGFNLLMFVRGEGNCPNIYCANPESGEIRYIADLSVEENDMPADGLLVSSHYNPLGWSLIGMVNQGALRYIRIWHIDYRTDWLSIEPVSGSIEPEDESEITLHFNAQGYDNGLALETTLILENDGRTPIVEIPVTLEIYNPRDIDDFEDTELPVTFNVSEVFPNPFNAVTQIQVDLSSRSILKAGLYNIQGRRILTLADEIYNAGRHQLTINAEHLTSGIYFVVIEANSDRSIRKIALIR